MKESTKESFKKVLKGSKAVRSKVRDYVQRGEWHRAEEDDARRIAFQTRQQAQMASQIVAQPEALQGDTRDFQPVSFLGEGARVRRAVAKIEVDNEFSIESGTGFLVSADLFLTNHHVVKDQQAAENTTITFDYETDQSGVRQRITSYRLAPQKFQLYSDEEDLDYALIALGDKVQGDATPADFGYCPISDTPDRHQIGMNVNVIQHPNGILKTIAVRNNLLTHRTDTTLLYETDTLKGSSGAPVFNDSWDVVALHHYGAPSDDTDESGNPLPREINEGIRISRIFQDLTSKLPNQDLDKRQLLGDALALFSQEESSTTDTPRRLTRGNPISSPAPEAIQLAHSSISNNAQGMSFVIPLEVTVKIPNVSIAPSVALQSQHPNQHPMLSNAEGKKLDRDYSNRNGFASDFITGVDVDLATIVAPLKSQITPLKDGQVDAANGVLNYQNFSAIMNSNTRFAMITATNINGATYESIDRQTGDLREGESWYIERRIDRDAFIDQDFYSAWSHLFDRGHLTRRNDPTWGSATEAKRANADTFHFTNCSPQQWRFNQSAEFWQGIERYVLENGIEQNAPNANLTVLQGMLFNDHAFQEVQVFADDVRIPVAFWKLVLWRGSEGIRAVALVASQDALLDEFRQGGSQPGGNTEASVEEFRVSIAHLSARTQLDFSALDTFDTIAEAGAADVGESARRQRLRPGQKIKL